MLQAWSKSAFSWIPFAWFQITRLSDICPDSPKAKYHLSNLRQCNKQLCFRQVEAELNLGGHNGLGIFTHVAGLSGAMVRMESTIHRAVALRTLLTMGLFMSKVCIEALLEAYKPFQSIASDSAWAGEFLLLHLYLRNPTSGLLNPCESCKMFLRGGWFITFTKTFAIIFPANQEQSISASTSFSVAPYTS